MLANISVAMRSTEALRCPPESVPVHTSRMMIPFAAVVCFKCRLNAKLMTLFSDMLLQFSGFFQIPFMFFYNAYSFTYGSVISRFKMLTQLINKILASTRLRNKALVSSSLCSYSPSWTVKHWHLLWFSNTHLKSSFCRWYFYKLWLQFQNPS